MGKIYEIIFGQEKTRLSGGFDFCGCAVASVDSAIANRHQSEGGI